MGAAVGRDEFIRSLEPVVDVEIDEESGLERLVEMYDSIYGFMAGHLSRSAYMLAECMKDADLRLISFTANLVATGLRGILAQLIRRGVFNLVVTTCGTVDHDIARGTGHNYYKGYFEADDRELRRLEIHRLGNIFIPFENYGPPVEKTTYRVLDRLDRDREWGIYEILWEIGSELRDGILRAAYETHTPVIIPGYLDGAFGTALFTYTQTHRDLRINPFRDEEVMASRFFSAKKAAGLLIGGGISKHHSIWWAQFREGFDCVVYMTTAVEYDGSLSGARPREAISWGKVRPDAGHIVVYGDASVMLPPLAAYLLSRLASGRSR